MKGSDYIAVRRLSAREDDVVLADIGETCERVPESSLPFLLEVGRIKPLEERRAAPRTPGRGRRTTPAAPATDAATSTPEQPDTADKEA